MKFFSNRKDGRRAPVAHTALTASQREAIFLRCRPTDLYERNMEDFEIGFFNSPAYGLVFFSANPLPELDEDSADIQPAKAVVVRDPSSLRISKSAGDGDSLLIMKHPMYEGRQPKNLAVSRHENPNMLARLLSESMATPVGEAVFLSEGKEPYRTQEVEKIADRITSAVTNGLEADNIGFQISD